MPGSSGALSVAAMRIPAELCASSVAVEVMTPTQASAVVTSTTQPLSARRLLRAKTAYTTRFLAKALAVHAGGYSLRAGPAVAPRAGDIVLARVLEIGKHTKLESPASRRQTLFPGDELLVAYGHRYASDQFEAHVPDSLGDEVHLVAAGGLAGLVTAQHASIDQPTRLQPIGLLANPHGVVNLSHLAPRRLPARLPLLPEGRLPTDRPAVVAVLGTAMNSGKTTTLACLARGLAQAGLRVSAGKVTGTGAGGDPGLYKDAGAERVLDFTDFGFPSTFRLGHDRVRALLVSLVSDLTQPSTDVVLVEIADGVYQEETARLLADPVFHAVVDRVVFSATDALGATAGLTVLRGFGADVAAISGFLTASPLSTRETAGVVDVPVIDTFALTEPGTALKMLP